MCVRARTHVHVLTHTHVHARACTHVHRGNYQVQLFGLYWLFSFGFGNCVGKHFHAKRGCEDVQVSVRQGDCWRVGLGRVLLRA